MTNDWIIQRCTQRWVGTDLMYEDLSPRHLPYTKEQAIAAMDIIASYFPNDEFRAHRINHIVQQPTAYLPQSKAIGSSFRQIHARFDAHVFLADNGKDYKRIDGGRA